MKIYPAIDIKDGKSVMLKQGNPEDKTVYSDNPLEIALRWEKKGAEFIHIVDLDGAIHGKSKENLAVIKKIKQNLTIPIQVGGGIRDEGKIFYLLEDIGIDRIIVGTLAIENRDVLSCISGKFPSRIAVSIDVSDGFAAIKGWTEDSNLRAMDLCYKLKDFGIDTVIYTDISRDGMLQGPNTEFAEELIEKTGLKVIVSGGVTTLDDIKAVKKIGAAGVIIGKALYDGKIDLQKAIETAKEELI